MTQRLLDLCLEDAKKYLTYKEYAYPDKESDLARKYRRQPWGNKHAREILNFLGVSETKGRPWAVGYGFRLGVTPDHRLTKEMATHKLKEVILESIRDASYVVPNFKDQPVELQSVLAAIARELGKQGLYSMRTTLTYCVEKDYRNMAIALKKTLWYSSGNKRLKNRLIRRVESLAN